MSCFRSHRATLRNSMRCALEEGELDPFSRLAKRGLDAPQAHGDRGIVARSAISGIPWLERDMPPGVRAVGQTSQPVALRFRTTRKEAST